MRGKFTLRLLFFMAGFAFCAVVKAQSPEFVWAKSFGGQSCDYGMSVAIDAAKNVYTTGQFVGVVDFDPGPAVANMTSAGDGEIYISKLDVNGNFVWAKQFKGSNVNGGGAGLSVAVDASGNIYATGVFHGIVDFDPGAGIFNLTSNGCGDIFLCKLDPNGNLLWAGGMGAEVDDRGLSITIDHNDDVILTGSFMRTVDFNFGPAVNSILVGGNLTGDEIFVAKYDANGNFLWVSGMGNTSSNAGSAVAVDATNNIYVTGRFESTVDFNPQAGVFNLVNGGCFVSKFDPNGIFVYTRKFGENTVYNNAYGFSIALDAAGSIYVAGQIVGTVDMDPSPVIKNITATGRDMFVMKLTNTGLLTWIKTMPIANDLSNALGNTLALDAAGNIYVAGNFDNTTDFDPGPASSSFTPGSWDAHAMKLDNSGNLIWIRTIADAAGNQPQTCQGIVVDDNNSIYFTGYFYGSATSNGQTDFDPCPSVYNLTPVNCSDAFVARWDQFPVSVTITSSAVAICPSTNVTFTATPVNGGSAPGYQWQINGINTGPNGPVFSSVSLANGDVISCILTSSDVCADPRSDTSDLITMTVSATVTASVSITASTTTICPGSSVTFTATPANEGTAPIYQWQVNGINAGTNSSTFTSITLANNDIVTCLLTSNQPCVPAGAVGSNAVVVAVNSGATASISIAGSANNICTGTSVTFTATPTNGGSAPVYQWQVNGINAGTNNAVFTSTTLANNDIVTCLLTSNEPCISPGAVTSNSVTMIIAVVVVPSISIVASANNICPGSSVTFTATATNGGSVPFYQWKVNGTNAGTNSSTFTSTTFVNGDIVTCVLTSNSACASPSTATSNGITMIVGAAVVPSVSIVSSANNICPGTSVTFTASPTNGGSTPFYQWKINGVNTGTNSSTFTSTTFVNGDIVTCVLTSNSACASPITATSNSITMIVSTAGAPSISIAASANNICTGIIVTFTATFANGGLAPIFQWLVNGTNAGANNPVFTSTTLINGDIVSCVFTSNAPCSPVSATSNTITMIVGATALPSISIAGSANNICPGTSVTFTATPVNGGSTPSYQWKINGINAGANSSTFTSTSLLNGDVVSCVLTSNSACASPLTATSNTIAMVVNAGVVPSISILASANNICPGTSVTFTATPTNGGSTPSYQWKINGVNTGTSSATFTSAGLLNGDIVSCVLTSNSACASPLTATSNSITMIVNANAVPSISIVGSANNICAGSAVTFTATTMNGGSAASYQWLVSGFFTGTNSPTFTSTTLVDGDVVSCILTSNSSCASPTTANSNSIAMVVNPIETPTVGITSPNNVCEGTNIIFTAGALSGGGSNPSYQWQINGINVGSDNINFNSTTFANGDVVTCVLTSNAACVTTTTALSNSIVMIIHPLYNPSISVIASANPICTGSSVTFTATTVNGGASPTYQWKVNGTNAGTNSSTFASSTLANGDVVSCVFTNGGDICWPSANVVSNSITMIVNTTVTPSINISASTNNICAGIPVTFTATVINSGATPIYQWKVNGINTGTNSSTFTSSALVNADIVGCEFTSSALCTIASTIVSNSIVMIVSSTAPAAISINGTQAVCAGEDVTFTSIAVGAGTGPVYQWQVNGINAGSNSPAYSNNNFSNGDQVVCILTPGNSSCSNAAVTSNIIPVSIYALPIVNISPTDTIVDPGSQVHLNAIVSANVSSYEWLPAGNLSNGNSLSPVTHAVNDSVHFIFNATTNDGCVISKKIRIRIYKKLALPNAFTPNNDGLNDVFRIPPGTKFTLDDLSVFNRWGTLVFSTNDIGKGWNGKYRGVDCETGAYIYIIKGSVNKGVVSLKGTVMLIR